MFFYKTNLQKIRIFVYIKHFMKRLLSILLMVFYLFLTAGVPITVHYCHGQIEEIKILAKSTDCCEKESQKSHCCMNEDPIKCCSYEHLIFHLDIDEEVISCTPVVKVKISSLNFNFAEESDAGVLVEDDSYHFTDLPPPIFTPIWLLNCNFSFYG